MRDLIERTITDPRSSRKNRYSLYEILMLCLLGILSGETTFTGIEEFGHINAQDLEEFFEIKKIPSHDTLRLLFERIEPQGFIHLFNELLKLLEGTFSQDLVSLDGKTICNSGSDLLHIVSAWSHENRLVIGHMKTKGRGTEIEGLKEVLKTLDVKGHIVTIDALGCQKSIMSQIADQEGDYVVSVKGNQGTFYEEIKAYFLECESFPFFQTLDKKRGTVEQTTIWVTDQIAYLLENHPQWSGLKSIAKVETQKTKNNETKVEERFYITSLDQDAQLILKAVKAHWGIENNVHWVLDVMMNEDKTCIKNNYSAENMNVIKKISINILYSIQKNLPKKTTLKSLQRRFGKISMAAHMIQNLLKFFHS